MAQRLGTRGRAIKVEALCRAAAALIFAQEALAARLARGEPVPVEQVTTLASELRRVLRALGLAEAAPEDDPQRLLREMLDQIAAAPGPP